MIVHGSVWDEADKYARNLCEKDPEINQYCHPFDNERIWKGHSSMVDEIKEQMSSDNAGKGKRKKMKSHVVLFYLLVVVVYYVVL